MRNIFTVQKHESHRRFWCVRRDDDLCIASYFLMRDAIESAKAKAMEVRGEVWWQNIGGDFQQVSYR